MDNLILASEFGKWFKRLIGKERPAKVARILGINRENVYAMQSARAVNYKPQAQTLKRLGLTPMFRIDNPPDFSQPDPIQKKKKKKKVSAAKKKAVE